MFDLDEEIVWEPTADELAALEDEMLARLVAAGGSATLRTLFDGARPIWAIEAADRLLAAELIELVPAGGIAVTAAGRDAYKQMPVCPHTELCGRQFDRSNGKQATRP